MAQTTYFDWLSASSASLQAKFREAANINHTGLKGGAREDHVRNFLRSVLPSRFGVAKGEIVNADGLRSCECEVIIYNALEGHSVIQSQDIHVFPAEYVFAVVEVKSSLDGREIDDCLQKARTIKAIRHSEVIEVSPAPGISSGVRSPPIIFDVIAFTSKISDVSDSIHKKLEGREEYVSLRDRDEFPIPNVILTLDKSVTIPIATNPGHYPRFADMAFGKDSLGLYYALLHDTLKSIHLPPLSMLHYLERSASFGNIRGKS